MFQSECDVRSSFISSKPSFKSANSDLGVLEVIVGSLTFLSDEVVVSDMKLSSRMPLYHCPTYF